MLASALPGAKQWSGHDTLGPDDFELDPKTTGANGVRRRRRGAGHALDIASFLPESIREHFEVVVSEFIFRPWKRDFGGGLEDVDREPEYEVESDEEDNANTRPGAQRPEHRSGGRGRRSVGLNPRPSPRRNRPR